MDGAMEVSRLAQARYAMESGPDVCSKLTIFMDGIRTRIVELAIPPPWQVSHDNHSTTAPPLIEQDEKHSKS